MSRRAYGEGSVYQRGDGRWCGALRVEGRRRLVYAPSKRAVLVRLAELRRQVAEGQPAAAARLTVGEQLTGWLKARTDLTPNSRRAYEAAIRRLWLPRLGSRKLAQLSAQDVRTAYAEWLAAGSGAATVRAAHAVLRQALGQAERDGLVSRNVASLVSAPAVARVERPTFTADEARRLLAAVESDRLCALWTLAMYSGMRRGELLGLLWADVELEAGSLWVRRQLRRGKDGQELAETKTRASRRPVDLAQPAALALRRHRAQAAAERLAAGRHWQDTGLVFCDAYGAAYRLNSFTRRHWYPLLESAGLPRLRLHDLRHTVATLLLGAGVHQAIVAALLGHSKTSTTIQLYSHVSPSMQKGAIEVLERLLSGT